MEREIENGRGSRSYKYVSGKKTRQPILWGKREEVKEGETNQEMGMG